MKIFGIGLFKTGTTTLGEALKILGYNVAPEWWYLNLPMDLMIEVSSKEFNYKENNVSINWNVVEWLLKNYEAFEDYPWMYLPKYLYYKYPNAKFINTLRPEESLRKSEINVRLREGWDEPDSKKDVDENIIPRYRNHLNKIRDLFENNPNYKEFNWFEGDEWEKLCEFLNLPIPNIPFPHKNKGKYL